MIVFLLDIWHDLRAKRLWPVAVALLLGLIAIPVLLAKPSGEQRGAPAPSPSAYGATEPKALASVKLATDDRDSQLDTFDPSDPFGAPSTGASGAGSAEVAAADPSASDGAVAGPNPVTSSGETGSSGSVSSDGSSGSTGESTGGSTGGGHNTTPRRVQYSYVADVRFTVNGETREIKGLQPLEMLPRTASPVLVFMGVAADEQTAVFLVDDTLREAPEDEAATDGRCEPTRARCVAVHIKPGARHAFVNADGDRYRVRVDMIRAVELEKLRERRRGEKRNFDRGDKTAHSPGMSRSSFVPPLVQLLTQSR